MSLGRSRFGKNGLLIVCLLLICATGGCKQSGPSG